MKTPKRSKFKVGIRKDYFPRKAWKPGPLESFMDVVEIKAVNREEAARVAWKLYGETWQERMVPNRQIVSLDVDSPTAGVGGLLGRLEPITVYRATP